jgi:flagellin
LSDGVSQYQLNPTTVDISNKKSVENFLQTLEESLAGSAIKANMDLDGNITFKRLDGGRIILQEFISATGRQGSWSPSAGQGETISLNGKGTVQTNTNGYTAITETTSKEPGLSYIPIEGADLPISTLSIETQDDSEKALGAIDFALDYVAAERSNLGAIQNRLTHTIDNLTNIVTNTEASQSKILDADYAKETTELTRTQIIQQAATAMLAQANQSAQTVLELLR